MAIADELGFLDGELEDWVDETVDAPFESDEGFIEFPAAWARIAEQMLQRCIDVGLVGSLLATEVDHESELLTVLLRDIGVEASYEMRGWLLTKLEAEIQAAVGLEPMAKRLRGDGLGLNVQRILDTCRYPASSFGNPSSSESFDQFLPFKGTRKTGKITKRMDVEGKDRATIEAEDLCKQQAILIRWLMEAEDLPSVSGALRTADPNRTLAGLCGKARASTMKVYLKRWGRFREWLLRSFGCPWPTEAEQLVDFFYVLKDEPCGASVPQATWQAMSWMESVAGLRDECKLSANSLVTQTLDFVISQLGTGAVPGWQAPRFPAIVLGAMELYLRDARIGIMLRIHCGNLLARAWATLRFDDIQHMDPDRLRTVSDALVTELMRTKTSGAGKRNKELPVALWVNVTVLGNPWVSYWLQLLRSVQDGPRDYLLQRSSGDGCTPINKMLRYADSAAITQNVLMGLKIPVWDADGGWRASGERLLSALWKHFWSEHSPRSVLPSLAAILEPCKDHRDMLGRWCPSGSLDYSRTFRVVVINIQKRCCASIREGLCNTTLLEDDVIDRAIRFFTERKSLSVSAATDISSQLRDHMQRFNHTLSQVFLHELEWGAAEVLDAPVAVLGEEDREVVRLAREVKVKEGKYVIVYSRKRSHARLHKVKNGCFWSKLSLQDFVVMDQVTPSMYNSRCKHCWPTLGVEESDSGSSTDESS